MTSKVKFSDFSGETQTVESCWNLKECVDSSSQTPEELFQFSENEMQTGIKTEIVQDEVKAKYEGMKLLDFISKKHKRQDKESWKSAIEGGKITVTNTVECQVQTNPESTIGGDYFIEYVNISSDVGTQTMNMSQAPVIASSSSGSGESKTERARAGEGKGGDEDEDEYNEYSFENDGEGKSGESKAGGEGASSHPSDQFLRNNTSVMERVLADNASSTAFDGYAQDDAGLVGAGEMQYWQGLSVDLEKKKVVYPDWSTAKHRPGRIAKCVLTRNRERVYDVDFEDSSVRLTGVREEHIRLVGENLSEGKLSESGQNVRLQEGMRVHCYVKSKRGGSPRFLPGRVKAVHKGGRSYDIEVEGGQAVHDVQLQDLVVGLLEGQQVESRQPSKTQLQCTGVSWNAPGSSVAAAYGRNDIVGWCDSPGAVCVWNIFSKNFNAGDPDYTLDHPSCIMSTSFHPELPSVVAAGSFNGEVIVWDLNNADPTMGRVSPIADYAHKEPVTSLQWVQAGIAGGAQGQGLEEEGGGWLLASAGADGRVLFWSYQGNGLLHPVLGGVLSRPKGRGSSSRSRPYPAAHGASALAFSSSISGSGPGSASGGGEGGRPQWLMAGQECGGLIRGQTARILGGTRLNMESLNTAGQDRDKERERGDGLYPPVRRADEGAFSHDAHVGSVHGIAFSPFSRNLFLTCGSDGTCGLRHLLEASPIRIWEPAPAPGTAGIGSEPFSPLTAVEFSPTRPAVFATASSNGFVYLFDLAVQEAGPVGVLEVPREEEESQGQGEGAGGGRRKKKSTGAGARRAGFTGLAFNRRQRGMVAACDYAGKVHIWRLGWSFTSRKQGEDALIEGFEGAR